MQDGDHADIELVIHYQMLSTPHAKHKTEPAKTAKLPSVSHLPTALLLVRSTAGMTWTVSTLQLGMYRQSLVSSESSVHSIPILSIASATQCHPSAPQQHPDESIVPLYVKLPSATVSFMQSSCNVLSDDSNK